MFINCVAGQLLRDWSFEIKKHRGSWSDQLILSIGIVIVACVVWQALRLATPIGEKMGITGLNVATRVMGLLLVAIGVQMVTSGLANLLPGLA